MNKRVRELVEYLKTTAIGGLLFLLPVGVIVFLLGYVYQTVVAIYTPIKPWIPVDSALGVTLLFAIAIALVLGSCFFAGIIARRTIGDSFSQSIESQLIKVFPRYAIYKDLIAGNVGGSDASPSLTPVIVKSPQGFRLAFQSDVLPNGITVVYLPGSPDTWSGHVVMLPTEDVQPFNVPFAEAVMMCERLGRNTASQLGEVSWGTFGRP